MKHFLVNLAMMAGLMGTPNAQDPPVPPTHDPERVQMARTDTAEPSYCDPSSFLSHEIQVPPKISRGLRRSRVFRLGQITLTGLAVGDSNTKAVKRLSQHFAQGPLDTGSCTWYLHHNKKAAEETLNWSPIFKNPRKLDEKGAAEEFDTVLWNQFSDFHFYGGKTPKNNFLACLEQSKYLAIGCQGMRHRGPSAFAMILAFSGCTPTHSVEIANHLWGSNRVKYKVRIAIAEAGFELGEIFEEERRKFQEMTSPETFAVTMPEQYM